MLTPYSRLKFITKILTSATGEQFRVVFLLALVNGEIKAQVVSATPITAPDPICLPAAVAKTLVTFTYSPSSNPVVSPFDSLFFFNSQPTRAPSY